MQWCKWGCEGVLGVLATSIELWMYIHRVLHKCHELVLVAVVGDYRPIFEQPVFQTQAKQKPSNTE